MTHTSRLDRRAFIRGAMGVAGVAFSRDAHAQERPQVRALRITVLSTMLAGETNGGIGEWGFAALVEADGRRILFDTGARRETVLANVKELGLDLTGIPDLIISHNHGDHTGGLLNLRSAFAAHDRASLGQAHVARGIFWPRPTASGDANGLLRFKDEFERAGGVFVEHTKSEPIAPGIWVTGPVPRVHPERNWSGAGRVQSPDGLVEDTIPEDMSLVFDTASGLVLLSGCGHAGIINTLEHARKSVRNAPVHAAIGGFHLFAAADDRLSWTGAQLKAFGLQHLLGAHCTGIEAVYRLRDHCGLSRATATVGSVGASFTLGSGITPTSLAR
jgi:7,8-dihydropterin-6-yl-methyl-4-(beta-D-ribofuranosyl)aminobenzene 5'-phosphate synthase